jgi:hypothetical protein
MTAQQSGRPMGAPVGPRQPVSPGATRRPARLRWLLPGAVVAVAVGVLVLTGVLPLSVVLYGGFFVGMVLMHVGGHGGHGGQGVGSRGHQHDPGRGDARSSSSGAQPAPATSLMWPGSRAVDAQDADGAHDDDQHHPHACH